MIREFMAAIRMSMLFIFEFPFILLVYAGLRMHFPPILAVGWIGWTALGWLYMFRYSSFDIFFLAGWKVWRFLLVQR